MLRRTAAEWERILSAYDASGLGVAGFARSWGVSVATLRWQQGEVVERGTHAELLAHGGVYANLWSIQQAAQ
jgi:DNA-binding transcriptional regulator YiaG